VVEAGVPPAADVSTGPAEDQIHAYPRGTQVAGEIVNEVVRQTEHDQLAPRYSPVLPAGKPGYRPIHIILSGFAVTMAANPDSVVHGAQVAGSRLTRGAQALRLSFGFVPRSASGRSGSAARRPRRSARCGGSRSTLNLAADPVRPVGEEGADRGGDPACAGSPPLAQLSNAFPVSSSVLRSLSTQLQPPPPSWSRASLPASWAAVRGAFSSSWVTVSLV
jgi:hypothetical protein